MARRIGQRDVLWLSLISAAFILLAVQIFLGATSGFDRPHTAVVIHLLEAPGIVLGWGGVALCVVAIPYALVSWTRGNSPGKVLAVFGTVVCAVGVAGLAGVVAATPLRGGGAIGGYLARLLSDALGSPVAFCVMLGIAIPGLLLALGPLMLDTSPVGPTRAKRPEAKPWYPKPAIGPDGLEVPMQLPGTDVGPIRFREDEPAAPAPVVPPEPVSVGRSKQQPVAGVRYADGGDDDGPAIAEVADAPAVPAAPAKDASLPFGVRYAAEPTQPPSDREAPASADAATPVFDASPLEPEFTAEPSSGSPPAPAPDSDLVDSPPPSPADPAVAESSLALSPAPQESIASHRQKLATSGVFERGRPDGSRGGKPSLPKPKPAKPQSLKDALRGLFTNLPIDELPPARTGEPDGPEPEPSAHSRETPDAPGQLRLFASIGASGGASGGASSGASGTAARVSTKAAVARPAAQTAAQSAARPAAQPATHPAAKDELFLAAVDAAIERGTASLVLLKRKFNVGYSRAASLMDALVAEGILGEMTASGSRPTLITAAEWAKRKKA